MLVEPGLEGLMVVEVVLVGGEAEGPAGGDVGGEVVDVEGVFRDKGVFVDGVLVDLRVWLDGIRFEGKDGTVEEGEIGVGIEDPGAVDGVGVGEEDETVACGGEAAGGIPHRGVGYEDVSPRGVEFGRRGLGAEDADGPGGVIVHGDAPGLELVLLFEEFPEGVGGVGMIGGEQFRKGGFEIEIQQHLPDVEEEIGHGVRSGRG